MKFLITTLCLLTANSAFAEVPNKSKNPIETQKVVDTFCRGNEQGFKMVWAGVSDKTKADMAKPAHAAALLKCAAQDGEAWKVDQLVEIKLLTTATLSDLLNSGNVEWACNKTTALNLSVLYSGQTKEIAKAANGLSPLKPHMKADCEEAAKLMGESDAAREAMIKDASLKKSINLAKIAKRPGVAGVVKRWATGVSDDRKTETGTTTPAK